MLLDAAALLNLDVAEIDLSPTAVLLEEPAVLKQFLELTSAHIANANSTTDYHDVAAKITGIKSPVVQKIIFQKLARHAKIAGQKPAATFYALSAAEIDFALQPGVATAREFGRAAANAHKMRAIDKSVRDGYFTFIGNQENGSYLAEAYDGAANVFVSTNGAKSASNREYHRYILLSKEADYERRVKSTVPTKEYSRAAATAEVLGLIDVRARAAIMTKIATSAELWRNALEGAIEGRNIGMRNATRRRKLLQHVREFLGESTLGKLTEKWHSEALEKAAISARKNAIQKSVDEINSLELPDDFSKNWVI